MSDKDLTEMKARCDAATPGPWYPDSSNYQMYVWGPQSQMILDTGGEREEEHLIRMRGVGACLPLEKNGEFIAHARIDLPRCIAEIERLHQVEEMSEIVRRRQHEELERLRVTDAEEPKTD